MTYARRFKILKIDLNKCKKGVKESNGKMRRLLSAAIAQREKTQYCVGSSSSKKPYMEISKAFKKDCPSNRSGATQVFYENVP